ncbi:hypothetical protein QBK93_24135 [Rhizobium leguminosarum]|uniref:hypothetical protein n=1 Tax=Rhizobium leguminosarum TaxID=384 RepID=UPI0024A95E3A|nr:hypothetical protein [Rhizobium leguminosarum]MDI5927758.1 hypothetical protein [Rhizobium leguminosarum]
MTPVILMAAALLVGLCVLAVTLAIHALPLMIGLAAGRLAIACGAPIAIAAIIGLVAAVSSFSALVYLQVALRLRRQDWPSRWSTQPPPPLLAMP